MTDVRRGKPLAPWRAGALVYSGRRDPMWDVSPAAGAAWVARFETLERTHASAPDQARLGYRGVWLLAPDGRRWNADGGLAWIEADRRTDPERTLERALLETAPAGALPPDWMLWLRRAP